MTYGEMVVQIPCLSIAGRLQLLELLSRSVREALEQPEQIRGSAKQLLGILKIVPIPTDEKVDQMRYEYLMEKYS